MSITSFREELLSVTVGVLVENFSLEMFWLKKNWTLHCRFTFFVKLQLVGVCLLCLLLPNCKSGF